MVNYLLKLLNSLDLVVKQIQYKIVHKFHKTRHSLALIIENYISKMQILSNYFQYHKAGLYY